MIIGTIFGSILYWCYIKQTWLFFIHWVFHKKFTHFQWRYGSGVIEEKWFELRKIIQLLTRKNHLYLLVSHTYSYKIFTATLSWWVCDTHANTSLFVEIRNWVTFLDQILHMKSFLKNTQNFLFLTTYQELLISSLVT